ncbi:MAG: hypothetical protein Q9211_004219 [Gyalolechia sp. 1 TL-2023]
MANDSDDYHLGRTYAASARLNLQHYLWMTTFGNRVLNCKIPVDDDQLKVADIATGTGIWLLDFARQHPRAARLDGFDISLDQVPSAARLPSNVSFHQFNVLEQPPDDLVERYDIVHVRHLNVIITNNDPTAVLGHLLAMLKPGGYLQWGEFALRNLRIVKANQDSSSTHLERLRRMYERFFSIHKASWPERLGDVFKEAGLQEVAFEGKWTDDAYLDYHMHTILLSLEEANDRIPNAGKATAGEIAELRAELAKAAAETREGAVMAVESVIAVGRKPAE